MPTWEERFTPRPRHEPTNKLVDARWRLRSPSGRIVSCGIYIDDAPGLEVRVSYTEDDLLRSERAIEIGSARELAEEWRLAVLAKGGFSPID